MIPSKERGCVGKSNFGRFYKKQAEESMARYMGCIDALIVAEHISQPNWMLLGGISIHCFTSHLLEPYSYNG
jgi:hypothetical protein